MEAINNNIEPVIVESVMPFAYYKVSGYEIDISTQEPYVIRFSQLPNIVFNEQVNKPYIYFYGVTIDSQNNVIYNSEIVEALTN